MFFDDNLPKDKDSDYLEKNEENHPILKLINKKNSFISQSYRDNSFSNSDEHNQNINKSKNEILTPKNKIIKNNNNRYAFSYEKLYSNDENNIINKEIIKDEKRYSLKHYNIYNNLSDINKSLFNSKSNLSSSYNNNIILPSLNINQNLFRLNKKRHNNNFYAKTEKNDKINTNNNSVFDSTPRPKRYTLLEKFKGNKVLFQKSIEFCLLNNNSNKTTYRNLTSKETSNKINHNLINITKKINTDKANTCKKTDYKTNIKNNIILNFEYDKNQLNKKFNKRKSLNYNNTKFLLKDDIKTNNIDNIKSKEIKKRKSFVPKNKISNLKITFPTFNTETFEITPLARKKINIKKIITNKKNYKTKEEIKEKNNMTLKKNDNQNKSYYINSVNSDINTTNNEDKNSYKAIKFRSKKELINRLDTFYKSIIEKKNIQNNSSIKENKDKEQLNNIKLFSIYNINRIFNKNYIYKEEEKYIKKKRLKLIEKLEKNNKESFIFNSYVEEIKNYFLKNCVIDKITENIFANFEPLENKKENKNEQLQKREQYLNQLFLKLLNKSHRYCYSLNKILKLGESFLKQKKINIKVKSINNYILDMFNVYPQLLKKFRYKWNNKKRKEYNFEKIVKYFSIRNEKNQEYFDKAFFIYKERINNDLNLNINALNLREINEKKNTVNKTSKFNTGKKKSSVKLKKMYKSIATIEHQNQILNLFGNKTNERHSTIKIIKKSPLYEEDIDKKMENFIKIQEQFGFKPRTESFEKFAKMYRIPSSKLVNIINEKEEKKYKTFITEKTEKEIIFNKAKINLDNYNILKDRKLFHYSNNKLMNIEKRFSQILNLKKNQIQLNKKLKIDTMTIKFAGIDQLTKEAALIKTQEIEKDLPDVKLFDEFVSAIQRRKINQFDKLIQKNEEGLNRIINKQEVSTGNTLLIYATLNNLKSLAELLLLKGANPNIQNKFGNSALHIAFKNDNAFIINLLFEYGADQKLKNSNGLFPWQMSKSIKY